MPHRWTASSLTAGRKHLDGVRAVQGGVSSLGTGMDSSTHTTAIHALSESDEDMAVPGRILTPVDLVSTVSLDSESISGQTVELSSDSESVVEVGGP